MVLTNGFWRCWKTRKAAQNKSKRKSRCQVRLSINNETWFSKTSLSYGTVLKLTYMLIYNYGQWHIIRELELNKNTVSQWSYFVKQVIIDWVIHSSQVIGGPGKTVEIDVSKFGRRKYNRGHRVEGQWVFGGLERETGHIFLEPVETRDRDTLISLIKKWIKPGTTIISDYWKAYDVLGREGYEHLKVNHFISFVDAESGAHTNAIESTWRHAKHFLPEYCRKKENFVGYLAHYMFFKSVKSQDKDLFNIILDEIAKIKFYPTDANLEEETELEDTD